MTDNEIGYKIYVWEQYGYGFAPLKYDPYKDYTPYLNYYTNPEANASLRAKIVYGGVK